MREFRSGEVTPHEAVLGLLAQGRTTVAGLKGRLEREFPHARATLSTRTVLPASRRIERARWRSVIVTPANGGRVVFNARPRRHVPR